MMSRETMDEQETVGWNYIYRYRDI